MSVVSESFLLGKVCKRGLWHIKNINLKSLNKKNFTLFRQADGSQTRPFQISQESFRFCCPDIKHLMTADLLTVRTRPSSQLFFFFSPCRAPQHILWKPWCPPQSGTKRQRPFRCGGPGAVQLRARLCPRRPRHSHLHHQSWKHCRMGLSCANLSRYAQLNVCPCVAVYEVFTSKGETVKLADNW